MTCIVGFVEGARVWMGGDSAGVGGYALTVRADQKVFRNGPMLFGFTSSFRMGQLLRYALKVPHHEPDVDADRYMVTTFVDAVRECLKAHGFAKKESEVESGGTFLVGYRGELFCIHDDYQVAKAVDKFDACGCGQGVALGSLFSTSHMNGRNRAQMALEAAERLSAGVRSPFHIESLEADA